MTSLWKGLVRGAAAGAAGTTALNATTQADMAVRGRPASTVPTHAIAVLSDRTGVQVPGEGAEWKNRLEGLGGVTGAGAGLAVGAVAGMLRAAGVRLPTAVGGPVIGAAAMLATDVPMSRLGITDPRTWTREDWLADAVPHLIYGVVTHLTLKSMFAADERERRQSAPAGTDSRRWRRWRQRRARSGLLLRSAALGAASGCRSSAGPAAVALGSRRSDPLPAGQLARPLSRVAMGLLCAGELAADKHPSIPGRLNAQGLAPRVVLGAASAEAIARRDGMSGPPGLPAVVAAGAAVATAFTGVRMRPAAHRWFGTDVPGALVEDGAAALLAWRGARRPALR